MQIYLPVLTLLLGFLLNEGAHILRSGRARKISRANRRDQFLADVLSEALVMLNTAYEAAAAIGLEAENYGVKAGTLESAEQWQLRKPLTTACGSAAFNLDRVAVLLPEGKSPRPELEAMATATAAMTRSATEHELWDLWKQVDPAVLAARQAVGIAIRQLYRD